MKKRKTVAVPKNKCLDQKEIGKIVDNMSLFDDDCKCQYKNVGKGVRTESWT